MLVNEQMSWQAPKELKALNLVLGEDREGESILAFREFLEERNCVHLRGSNQSKGSQLPCCGDPQATYGRTQEGLK